MSTPQIRLLIVDDVAESRETIRRLLSFESDFEVVGEADGGLEAIALAKTLQPDCILMDVNMPGMDGITATEALMLDVPHSVVVMMSVQGEQEYLRRAMIAGARDYLTKPFSADDLVRTIKRVHALEWQRRIRQGVEGETARPKAMVLPVFSAKGGVGKTTIAVNLAVALAREYGKKVALVDCDLQFGDVAILLDLVPRRTLADLARDANEGGAIDADAVDGVRCEHASGVQVFCAPPRPEQAELVNGAHLGQLLDVLRDSFDVVVVDTPPSFQETVLAALDRADRVLLVTTMDLPTLKNVQLSLDVMETLGYPKEKIRLVINRADSGLGLTSDAVEKNLNFQAVAKIPSDGRTVLAAANRGVPFVVSDARAPVTRSIRSLAGALVGPVKVPPAGGIFGRRGREAAADPSESRRFGWWGKNAAEA